MEDWWTKTTIVKQGAIEYRIRVYWNYKGLKKKVFQSQNEYEDKTKN